MIDKSRPLARYHDGSGPLLADHAVSVLKNNNNVDLCVIYHLLVVFGG